MILSDGETLGVFLPWLGFYHCVFCEGSEVVPALDQLASAVNEFGTISFEYDSVGNRLQQTLNGNMATAGGNFFHPIHGSCQTGFLSSLFFCTIFLYRSLILLAHTQKICLQVQKFGIPLFFSSFLLQICIFQYPHFPSPRHDGVECNCWRRIHINFWSFILT